VPVPQGGSAPALSQASIDYAEQLGGSSHEGGRLYLIVGARAASEREAYRDEPSDENVGFARRAFSDAAVARATVRAADPVPVYEDMVGE
jgi:hypothetical protein